MSTDPQQRLLRKIKVLIVAVREMEEEVGHVPDEVELKKDLANLSLKLMKFLNKQCVV